MATIVPTHSHRARATDSLQWTPCDCWAHTADHVGITAYDLDAERDRADAEGRVRFANLYGAVSASYVPSARLLVAV